MASHLAPIVARSTILRSTVVARRVASSWRRAPVNRQLVLQEKSFHTRPVLFPQATSSSPTSSAGSAATSATPSRQNEQGADEWKHAAFLGEADSNDGFETQDIDRRPPEPLDAKNAAFLGEADSDDAFELDVIENPEAHTHKIDAEEAKNAAFLGEADSADAFEADKEAHPEDYSHRIDDASSSGMHGEPGDKQE